MGENVQLLQHTLDDNFSLVRFGCVLAMASGLVATVRLSGLFHRYDTLDSIPSWYFAQQKRIRARIIRQNHEDPNILFVYHTPFWRRLLLFDTMPPLSLGRVAGAPEKTIPIRLFGVDVDESSSEWMLSKMVSSNRYVTLELLRRLDSHDPEQMAICTARFTPMLFSRDLAEELVSKGLAECLPEDLTKYSQSDELAGRLARLETMQKHAQLMQYGIWKDWSEERLRDRILSAGKRMTYKGLQRLKNSVPI